MGFSRSLAALCLAGASLVAFGSVAGKGRGEVLAQRIGSGLGGVNVGPSNNALVSGGLNGRMNAVQKHQRQLEAGVKKHLWRSAGVKTRDKWTKAGEQTKNDWGTSGQNTLDALDLAGQEVLDLRHDPETQKKRLADMLKKQQVPATYLGKLFPPD